MDVDGRSRTGENLQLALLNHGRRGSIPPLAIHLAAEQRLEILRNALDHLAGDFIRRRARLDLLYGRRSVLCGPQFEGLRILAGPFDTLFGDVSKTQAPEIDGVKQHQVAVVRFSNFTHFFKI
ncbi:hypothetical protein [uncultured Alistipes sp.]|uniref:hypothetical protein n=1 Tax=uncultured Alistipes sp. TaxID=538949 RepID=UPI0034E934DE